MTDSLAICIQNMSIHLHISIERETGRTEEEMVTIQSRITKMKRHIDDSPFCSTSQCESNEREREEEEIVLNFVSCEKDGQQ